MKLNITAKGSLNQKIKTGKLKVLGTRYDSEPKYNTIGVIHLNNNDVKIQKNGTYSILKIDSFEDIPIIWGEFVHLLSPIINPYDISPPKSLIINASGDYNHRIDLQELALITRYDKIYCELKSIDEFIIKYENGISQIKSNGKYSITGCKTQKELEFLVNYMTKIINKVYRNC